MGKHATQGTGLVGRKNTTLKQGSKYAMQQRIRHAGDMASEVQTERFEPIIGFDPIRAAAFTGINPIAGQDFTQVGTNTYKLRVREGFIGLRRITVKPKDGKAFGVWVASYGGAQIPLLSNRGQALNFADAKDKLFALLITNTGPVKVRNVFAADKRPKAVKEYTGGGIEFDVCQVTLEPARVCEHCH
jgi:hypothetical protein